jgi:hypothetical protein
VRDVDDILSAELFIERPLEGGEQQPLPVIAQALAQVKGS